jgi:hypothetical protein
MNYSQNEILHICHLTYQNGMNKSFDEDKDKYLILKEKN